MREGQNTLQQANKPASAAHGLSDILRHVGTALYFWSAEDDRFRWSANAADLFSRAYLDMPRTGAEFTALLDEEVRNSRKADIAAASNGPANLDGDFDHLFTIKQTGLDGRMKIHRFAERGRVLRNPDGSIERNGSTRSTRSTSASLISWPKGSSQRWGRRTPGVAVCSAIPVIASTVIVNGPIEI